MENVHIQMIQKIKTKGGDIDSHIKDYFSYFTDRELLTLDEIEEIIDYDATLSIYLMPYVLKMKKRTNSVSHDIYLSYSSCGSNSYRSISSCGSFSSSSMSSCGGSSRSSC